MTKIYTSCKVIWQRCTYIYEKTEGVHLVVSANQYVSKDIQKLNPNIEL
jgi:hypothetical protein